MGGMVFLRHTLPDGSWHYDWMLDRRPDDFGLSVDPEQRRLVTFRTLGRPDLPETGAFEAERIGDHRAVYLTHEGPMSGGRGVVERIDRGRCLLEWVSDAQLRVWAWFADSPERLWEGRRRGEGPIWDFRC